MGLTREEIIGAAQRLGRLKVATPEWARDKSNGAAHVWVRELPANEATAARRAVSSNEEDTIAAEMTILCACDADGKALFQPGDAPALLGGPLAPLLRIANAAIHYNGLDVGAEEMVGK